MTILILFGVGAILAAITLYDYYGTRRILESELRGRAENLAEATAARMEVVKRAVEKVIEELAIVFESNDFAPQKIYQIMEKTVSRHNEIYGLGIAFTAPGTEPFIPYICLSETGLNRKDLAADNYPYQTYDWYTLPTELGRPVWTEPYYGPAGQTLMVTYCVPIYTRPDMKIKGVVVGDVSLHWLTEMIRSLDLGDKGYAFLISRNGTFVSHPKSELIMRETIFSIAQRNNNKELRELGRSMVQAKSGFVPFTGIFDRRPYWIAYAGVKGTGWSLGALFPKREIMAKLFELSRMKLALGSLGAIALVLVVMGIARSISRPIGQLETATQRLAGGNLDAVLPVISGNDEVAHLSGSFATMQRDLKKYIEELKYATAERERIESDLRIARDIQMSLVPSKFSFEPPHAEFDVFAMLDPAREVGGDLYDFFLLDTDKFFVSIADASGKGIPAALFMAVSRSYLRAFIRENHDPAIALTRLNNELAKENETSMFITIFCAIVDLKTGTFSYANGGHNTTFVLRKTGETIGLPKLEGFVVGPMENMEYSSSTYSLESGDTLFLYTDGVIEAENSNGELYGEDRMLSLLSSFAGKQCREITDTMRRNVHEFVCNAPQSDDITMLSFRYNGIRA